MHRPTYTTCTCIKHSSIAQHPRVIGIWREDPKVHIVLDLPDIPKVVELSIDDELMEDPEEDLGEDLV